MRAKRWLLFSPSNFFAPFFHVTGLLVPVLCGSQPLLVLSIVFFCEVCVVFFLVLPLLKDLCASGLRCLVPALTAQFVQSLQPIVVVSASAVTVCPAPAMALLGVWTQSFVPSLLFLLVELPWGLFCGIQSPWPLVAPSPSVVPRLGFFLWRLFRLGFEVLRSCLWIFPSFGGLCFPCPCCFSLAITTLSFCPGNLGFLDFFAWVSLSTSSVLLVVQSGLRRMFQFCPVFLWLCVWQNCFL